MQAFELRDVLDISTLDNNDFRIEDLDLRVRECVYNFQWHWHEVGDSTFEFSFSVNGIELFRSPKSYSCLGCLAAYTRGQHDDALGMLLNGQRHNENVVNLYNWVYNNIGRVQFWTLLCKTSIEKPGGSAENIEANLKEAKDNIDWQKANNPYTVDQARMYFSNGNLIEGMTWLMFGQRHNKNSMSSYRAAFRDSEQSLISLV